MRERLEAMLKGRAPVPLALRGPLALAAGITRAGMALRAARPAARVEARVISFGNLTLGGTGKTPAVIARAQVELEKGRTVAVLTRGYGAPEPARAPVAVPGSTAWPPDLWRRVGDEAALVAWRVPGCAIVRCTDRVAAARAAIDQLGCDTLLLDDGFQYLALARDENILLVDATCPFGNRRVFPAGYLREPLSAARRATEIVFTRCDQAGDLAALAAELAALAPGVPVRRTMHAPTAVIRLEDRSIHPLGMLRGLRVRAACGIANPGAFFATLAVLGAEVHVQEVFADHTVPVLAAGCSYPTIITEKDAVKLGKAPPETFALRIEMRDLG